MTFKCLDHWCGYHKSSEPKKVLLPRRLCPAIPNPILPKGSDCDCSSWSWVHRRGKLREFVQEDTKLQQVLGGWGELVFTEMPSCRVCCYKRRLSLIPGEKGCMRESEWTHEQSGPQTRRAEMSVPHLRARVRTCQSCVCSWPVPDQTPGSDGEVCLESTGPSVYPALSFCGNG